VSRLDSYIHEFGGFQLDALEGALYHQGELVPLTPKALETLVVLVENAGHVVSKEEMVRQVWPDIFVEEGNLTVNISALRKTLAEFQQDILIETIPRRGYRFTAPVKLVQRPGETLVIERRTRASISSEVEESEPAAIPATVPAGPARPGAALSRFRLTVSVIAALAFALLAGVLYWRSLPGEPVRVSVSGKRLFAWDERGRVTWEYEFSRPVTLEENAESHPVVFADLDGDGRTEVLVHATAPGAEPDGNSDSALYSFSSRGRLLWTYRPNLSLRFGEREFSGPWNLNALTVVPNGESREVWAVYRHDVWWPSFLVRVDARGAPEVRFVNAGHLHFLKAVQNISGNYLLAAGVNSEYQAGVLAVLRTDRPLSGSPQSPGSPYRCRDCQNAVPYLYFIFPRSEVFQLLGESVHRALSVELTPDVIRVTTFEGSSPLPGRSDTSLRAHYEFTRDFDLKYASLDESYWEMHRALEKQGRIQHSADDCPDRAIARRVRVWIPYQGISYAYARGGREASVPPRPHD